MLSKFQRVLKSRSWIKPKKFLLLCHQRSGSNMLSKMLNQHPNVELYGQLFKDDMAFQKRTEQLSRIPFEGPYFDDQIDKREQFDQLERYPDQQPTRNTATFVNQFFEALNRQRLARHLGIKIHGGTLYAPELRRIFLQGDYRILILHRKDRLAAAISWYQARELNQWMRTTDQKVQQPTMKMDIPTLAWFMKRIEADVQLWHRLVQEENQAFLPLTYEEITADDFDFTKIWTFLGAKNIGNPTSSTKKLIKDYSHIENIEAIRNTLGT